MAIDFTGLVNTYQQQMDLLIGNLGKTILVVFKPTIVTTTDDAQDQVRGDGSKKPVFKQDAPTITQNTAEIIGLIQYKPRELYQLNLPVEMSDNVVRIKTFLTNLPALRQAEYIIPNYGARNYIETKYKLLKEAVPIGLQQDRYCTSYWQRVV